MDMIVNTKTMLLEQLPTEVFLRIFASLQFKEIIKAFSSLNSRFNSIIQCINSGNFQVSYNDDESVRLIHSYPKQIHRLILTHSPNVDFTSSIHLRSLTIRYGTLAQLNAIRPRYFPILEILHICGVNGPSVIEKAKAVNDLFEVILSNGFPRLRICTAVGIEPLDFNEKWTGSSSSIRLLLLDGQTSLVDEKLAVLCPNLQQPRSLAQTPIVSPINSIEINSLIASPRHRERLLRDIMDTKRLECGKKFILDYCEQRPEIVLGGRIFPRSDPYYCASLRVEIKLPPEYPFKPPAARFLDPIHHPMIKTSGKLCSCWDFYSFTWVPTRKIVDYITGMINTIDNPAQWKNHDDSVCYSEYNSNYSAFYEKAMQSVLTHGQSRF